MSHPVLVIDTERRIIDFIEDTLTAAGLSVDIVEEGWSAINRLQSGGFGAVILDPMIRHRLNGFAVLNFIETEQPPTIDRLFLFTAMSEQTIARTAPRLVRRFYRKPCDAQRLVTAVLTLCDTPLPQRESGNAVLIVEDDAVTASALEALVRDLGFAVTVAHDGREALERLGRDDYAAVVLDLILPELDGFAVLQRVKESRADLLRRTIITTGAPENLTFGIDRGRICGLVHKPVEPLRFTELIHRAMEERAR